MFSFQFFSACALGSDGGIYVAGGCCSPFSKGMEVFYPHNSTVHTVITELSMEVGHNGGLQGATMTPVNNGKQLVLHGGFIAPAASRIIYEFLVETWNFSEGTYLL